MSRARPPRHIPPLSEIILNTVEALIVGLDTEGTIRLFNDRCVEVTGWPREEALGVDWLTHFIPPGQREQVLPVFHALLEGHGGGTAEGLILTRDRGERLIHWRNAVVRDKDGNIILVMGTGTDVTDVRRAARQDTLLSELNTSVLAGAPLTRVMAHALDGLAALSGFEVLCVERYHPATAEMAFIAVHAPANATLFVGLTVPMSESLSGVVVRSGEPLIEVHAEQRSEYRHPLLRSLGVRTFLCYPIKAGDEVLGTLSLASRTAQPLVPELRTYLPRVADALALVISRVEAVDRLRESEMRSRAVLDTAADGIITIDERGIVHSLNPAAERIFGFAAAELMGRNVSVVMPTAYGREHDHYLRRHLDTGEARIIGKSPAAVTGRRKDGSEFPLDLTVSETWLPTGRRLFTGIARDLTERTKLEAQLRQAQKMEAVGQLAGGVAHDFNNVLTGITGYTQLALRRMAADDPQRQYLDEIQRAAFRAANLTRQLLAFSRQQVLAPREFDLGLLVSDLGTMLRRLIGEDIELRVTGPADVAFVKADPGQIEQVIVNLAVNARDAMPNGGTLTIELSTVDDTTEAALAPGATTAGRFARLVVSDSGVGMSDEVLTHIFEPFFTTKEPGRGTGLGLATVYGIITQSGGHVRVHSELGSGTTFQIFLPFVAPAAAMAAERSQSAAPPRGNETILLVEDEAMVREVNAEQLREQGYRVLVAANAEEAQEVIRNHHAAVDLLVTDVTMPRTNGHALAALLTRTQPRLKILFVSGHPQSIALAGTPDAHFLQKPFRPGMFARKVRQVLDAPQ